ncbi:hypothetical protein V8J88_00775 [Massilia sp. W12]|uniref:hypothetical protein n=1 Tax=Massilia sp. W12 TaxID=3126507 RepID=UPI0030CED423
MSHITVIAEDRLGLMAELAEMLAARQIDITDISAKLYGADAVIHLQVDQYEAAIHALEESRFHVVTDDAVLLRIEDRPGGLATVAKRLADQQIAIRSMVVVQRQAGYSIVAVGTDDIPAVRTFLHDVVVQ